MIWFAYQLAVYAAFIGSQYLWRWSPNPILVMILAVLFAGFTTRLMAWIIDNSKARSQRLPTRALWQVDLSDERAGWLAGHLRRYELSQRRDQRDD
jgi:hypothetical protein